MNQRVEPAVPPSASVIVVCPGQLEYTRLCVASLLQHSRKADELVFVDLASLDGTREFLQGVALAAPRPVRVFRVDEDWTVARAAALGAARSAGEHIVLLNNDVIVTQGWLEQLTALANSDRSVGMVGPMSNTALPAQFVADVGYRLGASTVEEGLEGAYPDELRTTLLELEAFARRWREENRQKWSEVEILSTFCVLLKREVFHKIGGTFSEEGTALAMADEPLSRKVRAAGYRLACCRDLFVHHAGTRIPGGGRQ